MPHQVTVTAKTGPDRSNTAAVLTGVTRIDFDLNDKVIQIYQDPQNASNVREYELGVAATVTFVNTGGNFAITIA